MPPYIPKDAIALLAKIPAIPARPGRQNLAELYRRLEILLDRSPRPRLLSILKYAAYIVVFANAGSLPFVWHRESLAFFLCREAAPEHVEDLQSWMLQCRFIFASKEERTRAYFAWAENLSPVGANPFEIETVYRRWATIDDIDGFGMHLSNSSYARAFDAGRGKALIQWFPAWVHSGGVMLLGATHYHFLREIAPLSRYEVRVTIGAWDHKWIYVIARYVTRPSSRQATSHSSQSSTPSTPTDTLTPTQGGYVDVEHAVAAIIHSDTNGTGSTRQIPIVEPDGAILHCVAVAQNCFKQGRITVPPAIVLASEGFTKPYGDAGNIDSVTTDAGMRSYSHAKPPPNWIKSQSIRVPPQGSMADFRAFLQGKWRDVPAGERWWEDALGGSIETKRQANLEILHSLKVGLERTQTMN
ncbi:hypothetical protein JVT61DRAFT_14787 [Boletus reticuloceps]|uniref:Uncharacterized protein n=1 Tax=Boletus reticuloceps TaxID=495285 RepID=A0A8I3AD43_9AGAM|nr:hypothetical protein JVT61DRAFT_14787 [Boletus reticuloceps]